MMRVLIVLAVLFFIAMPTRAEAHADIEHSSGSNVADSDVRQLLSTVYDRCMKLFAQLAVISDSAICVDAQGNIQPHTRRGACAPGCDDLSSHTQRLLRKHYPLYRLGEGKLVLSEFHDGNSTLIAANHNKGERIEVCCRSKQCDPGHSVGDSGSPCSLNSADGVMEVVLHELAHSMDCKYRTTKSSSGHGPCFEQLQNFLMRQAASIGVFKCSADAFCGIYHNKSGVCRAGAASAAKCKEQVKCGNT